MSVVPGLPTEFFPFGGGIRRCVGMAFALHEMRFVLARMLELADLVLAPRGEIRGQRRSITLMLSDGMRVRVARVSASS